MRKKIKIRGKICIYDLSMSGVNQLMDNKHIQRALVEAAKLAPRQNHEMAVIYDQERQKGNSNRATLAVARKMVAYLLAVDRQQRDFVTAEERRTAAA